MIKELIVAITLGALLGFGITGGYFAINKNSIPKTSSIPTPTLTPQISQSPTISIVQNNNQELSTSSHTINIETPENHYLSANPRITIKGTTSPNSLVFATTSINIYSSKSDSAGNFEIDIDLESGANLVKIESISESDEQANTEMLVTYSTAKI